MKNPADKLRRIERTQQLRDAFRELLDSNGGPKYIEEVLNKHDLGPAIACAVLRQCRMSKMDLFMDHNFIQSIFGDLAPRVPPEDFAEQLRIFRRRLEQGLIEDEEMRQLWRELQNEPQEEQH